MPLTLQANPVVAAEVMDEGSNGETDGGANIGQLGKNVIAPMLTRRRNFDDCDLNGSAKIGACSGMASGGLSPLREAMNDKGNNNASGNRDASGHDWYVWR